VELDDSAGLVRELDAIRCKFDDQCVGRVGRGVRVEVGQIEVAPHEGEVARVLEVGAVGIVLPHLVHEVSVDLIRDVAVPQLVVLALDVQRLADVPVLVREHDRVRVNNNTLRGIVRGEHDREAVEEHRRRTVEFDHELDHAARLVSVKIRGGSILHQNLHGTIVCTVDVHELEVYTPVGVVITVKVRVHVRRQKQLEADVVGNVPVLELVGQALDVDRLRGVPILLRKLNRTWPVDHSLPRV